MNTLTTGTSLLLFAALFAATFSFLGWKEIHDNNLTDKPIASKPYVTEWSSTASNGGTLNHKVETPRLSETEPLAEWAARHAAEVAALEVVFPPTPPVEE